VVGADRRTSGTIAVHGQPVSISNPAEAVRHGIGYLSEDRKRYGLMLDRDVRENVVLASMRRFASRLGFMRTRQIDQEGRKYIDRLRIKTPTTAQLVRNLSGGNQQKVVLARWLLRDCRVLLLDEPTRGVDVATKAELYRIIRDLAKNGVGVLVVSSELEELVGICSRILVMREGEIVAEVDGKTATERELLRHAVAPTDSPDLAEEVV
jgi:ribose transport system ATP-binding protein